MIVGAVIFSLDSDDASAGAGAKSGKKPAAATKEPTEKPPVVISTSSKEDAEKAAPQVESSGDVSGLLCQETAGLGGKIQKPLAAAWAVEGRGFIVRGAKVFADLHNAGGSTSKWVIQTPTKRYKVTGVKFHPEFPAEKLKALIAKGSQAEMVELIRTAERADLALLETAEAPVASMKLARDPATISGKPLLIVSPVDPKAGKAGQNADVKFASQPLMPEMLKEQGVGLAFSMAPGVDAAVTTKDGMLVAFVPRRNAATGATAVHPIIPAETLAELLGAK